MKATSSADYSGASWNKNCVAVFFRMKTVVDILLASGTSGIVKWSCSVVVGVVIVNNYRVMKGANWGSRI